MRTITAALYPIRKELFAPPERIKSSFFDYYAFMVCQTTELIQYKYNNMSFSVVANQIIAIFMQNINQSDLFQFSMYMNRTIFPSASQVLRDNRTGQALHSIMRLVKKPQIRGRGL